MIQEIKDKITWLDVRSPEEGDLKILESKFRLHPVLIQELKGPSARGKVEFFDHFIYLVIHFPYYDPEKLTSRPIEIDILASQDVVATIRYEDFPPLEDFMTKCEAIPGFTTHCLGDTPGHFLYRFFEHLFDYALRELKHINDKISQVEEEIFKNKEKEMIRRISYIKRDILDFMRILRPMRGILISLHEKGRKFYGEELDIYFHDLVGDYERLHEVIATAKDTIESLETTNQALLSSRIDEVMSILSVLAFLLAPFTIIGALFQINSRFTPIIGRAGDWWIIFAMMVLGSLILYLWFRKKKWL